MSGAGECPGWIGRVWPIRSTARKSKLVSRSFRGHHADNPDLRYTRFELVIATVWFLLLGGGPALGTVVSALKRHFLLALVAALFRATMFVLWLSLVSGTAFQMRAPARLGSG